MRREAHLLSQIMTGATAFGCRLLLPAAVGQGLQCPDPSSFPMRHALFFIAQVLQPNRA